MVQKSHCARTVPKAFAVIEHLSTKYDLTTDKNGSVAVSETRRHECAT
jgi:hypothetical protein